MATETAKKAKAHTRYYSSDGTLLPGVTTALGIINKPALIPWANKLGREGINSSDFTRITAERGTLAHAMIAAHLKGETLDISDYDAETRSYAENAVLSYYEWERGKQLDSVLVEAQMVSEEFRFGGTFDWYGKLDGVLTVIDFKTSSGIYDEHLFQLAAYGHLLAENGHPLEAARIVQVGRGENVEFSERVVPVDGLPAYFHVFKAALNLYNAIRLAKKGA